MLRPAQQIVLHADCMKGQESFLSRSDWLDRVANYRDRIQPYVDEHRLRHAHGLKHPVYDFLFSYYSFSGGQLLRWTPGLHVQVEVIESDELEWPEHFRREAGYFVLDPGRFPLRRVPFLRWAINFLEKTLHRSPVFHCFGLHEWAMVYKTDINRYPQIALRVSHQEVEDVIESTPLNCTHYDAFRFFSEEARPLNRHLLGQKTVTENDQPGCIHAAMDLYRLGYKVAPYVPSEFLGELFLLARAARELDMRASPYDLSAFGFSPIPIESKQGRETYVEEQRKLAATAHPLRAALLELYQDLLATILAESKTGPL